MQRASFGKSGQQYLHAASERKKRMQNERVRYTMILHSARDELGLTNNEYMLADAIHKLSGNRSTVPGWCFASKEHLGESVGCTERSVHNMLKTLKEKGIIESQEDTGYLRTTEKWREAVEIIRNMARDQGFPD